ncbi:MAG: glycosyl hydrolase family 32 [Kiritimatiellae bacterium]|nr:glycosyl hydrolase family 32 [Kiritimatiellia bacterium]
MNKKGTELSLILLTIAIFSYMPLFAADQPLAGEGAAIEYFSGEPDTFAQGVKLFTDREFKVAHCPEWLAGKKFLRNSINTEMFNIAKDGVLTLITPTISTSKISASQANYLEQKGFERINQPAEFQLFGKAEWDIARIYQKQVKAGEHFSIPKFVVVVGFSSAAKIEPKPWDQNSGEKLYNGIVLPKDWPPRTIDPSDTEPMPVPYLGYPPAVIPIDIGRQLLVDDFLVQQTTLQRVFHKPQKYSGNPILKPETELELHGDNNAAAVPKSGGLWWDPAEQIFKLWYEAGWIHTICYATSKDGLNWERPALDVKPGTNQALPLDLTPDSWSVVPDWDAKDPQQRYKMYMHPPGSGGAICMTSADGIHWVNRVTATPSGDRSTMFYNPFRKKWVYSLRSSYRGRSRHYWESDDFLKGAEWASDEPVVWAASDNKDLSDPETKQTPQLYNLDAVAYESIMLGMYEIHHGPPNDVCMKQGLPKITELNFAYSRDGFHWDRPDRTIDIPAERKDLWDRGYVQSLGNICCIQGDRLWIYYTGFQGDASRTNNNWMKNGMYDRGATGVAFLRRDGFASMDSTDHPGTLLTRPLIFTGSQFFVNAAAAGGTLQVEIQDLKGNPIPPYTTDNCRAITTDSTLEHVSWKGAENLDALKGKELRFKFTLTKASLYAFWVSRDLSGRSDGYVAGGGPGYTGMTDTVGKAALEAAAKVRDIR